MHLGVRGEENVLTLVKNSVLSAFFCCLQAAQKRGNQSGSSASLIISSGVMAALPVTHQITMVANLRERDWACFRVLLGDLTSFFLAEEGDLVELFFTFTEGSLFLLPGVEDISLFRSKFSHVGQVSASDGMGKKS